MKETIIIFMLLMFPIIILGYVHVFSYQDFSDFTNGQLLQTGNIDSNDDGTHGFHDRWGANKEYTFPNVEGDTTIYINTEKDLEVKYENDYSYLDMKCEKDIKTIMGLKEIPNPIRLNIMIYYDFYLDTTNVKDYSFVMFSTEEPGTIGRIWAEYSEGVFQIYRRIGKYSISEMFSKKIDMENQWLQFKVELRLGRDFRFSVNKGTITSFTTEKYYENIPFYYVGNWIEKDVYSACDVKIKTFVVAHNK